MTTLHGYLITFAYIFVFVAAYYARRFFRKRNRAGNMTFIYIFDLVSVLTPTALLVTLGKRWVFTEGYLPSQLPSDLTFSTFHFGMIILTVVGVLIFLKKASSKSDCSTTYFNGRLSELDYQTLKFGINLIGIELFKQIVFLNIFGGPNAYIWSGFPLQFCSLPFYLYVIIPFLKESRVKSALYNYVAIFSLIGGLSVMITGGGVFSLTVSLSLHTMIWHGTMVISALYVGAMTNVGKSFKNFQDALAIFLMSVVFIQIVNITFYVIGYSFPPIRAFDGFYLNPWGQTENVAYISHMRERLTNYGVPPIFSGLLITVFYSLFVSLGGYLLYRLYALGQKARPQHKLKPSDTPSEEITETT